MEKKLTINVDLKMTQEQIDAIHKEAHGQGKSFSDILRMALARYVIEITEAWNGNPYEPASTQEHSQ